MIRVLIMIAVAGFLVATVALSSAVAIGGPEAIARGVWAWGPHAWKGNWDSHDWHGRHHGRAADSGPQTTREIPWQGGGSVELDVPAEMTFTQAAGPAKLVITGSTSAVEAVEVDGGHIRFRGDHGPRFRRLTIALTAPDVTRFDLGGRSRLTIEGYDQGRLALDLSGDAEVVARGRTETLDLDLSGSSEADLSGLAAKGADVEVSGSGDATIAPTDWARLDISGAGDVALVTRPARLETDVSGAGKVRQENGPAPSAVSASTAHAFAIGARQAGRNLRARPLLQ
jgi:hypothetical protein